MSHTEKKKSNDHIVRVSCWYKCTVVIEPSSFPASAGVLSEVPFAGGTCWMGGWLGLP